MAVAPENNYGILKIKKTLAVIIYLVLFLSRYKNFTIVATIEIRKQYSGGGCSNDWIVTLQFLFESNIPIYVYAMDTVIQ